MTTRTGKKLVASPRHQKQYHDFVGRVEARKLHTKAMMRKIMDTIVDNVYGHVVDELKGFVHQISVHGDNDRATTSGEGSGSNDGASSSGNVLKPSRKRRAPSPPSSPTHIPSDRSTFDDTPLNALDDASLNGNSQPNYDVQFESSSSLYNAQSAENASLSVNAAPLPSNAQPNNVLQNNVQDDATLSDAQSLDNVQSSNKAPQTMQPYNASENAENILKNGIEGQNAEELSVHNAAINGNNGGGDNDLDNAHYYDALEDFHDDALDNSHDNALDHFQGDAQDNSQENLNNASENSVLLDNTSQLSSIGNDSSILSQSSGREDNNSNNSESVRISNEVVGSAQQQQQQQQEDSGNSSLESSPEVIEKRLSIVERLKNNLLAKGQKNAQNKDQNISQNNSQSVSQNSDDGPTSTPIVQNRTTYWRMIKEERRRLEQQQANVTIQQQLDNAQQETDATITTTTVDSVKIKEELEDGTTAVEVTMPADSGLSSPSGSINGSNLSLSQSPPLLPFPPPIFKPTQATPSTSTQSSAVKKQKVGHANINNQEPKMAPTKKNKLPWTTNRRKNPVLPAKPAASVSSSMIPILYCTAGTSSGGSKASRVIYPKKFKGALPRGRILVKAIRCYLCRGLLTSRTELYRHLKTVHRVKPLRCPLKDCAETFDIVQQFGGHIAQKHKRNFHWPCTECPRPTDPSVPPVVFERCHDLNTHIRYTHEEGIFGCPVVDCDFEAATGHLVTEHYNAVHLSERDVSSVSGDDESMAAAGDVPMGAGDEQMVPRDVPMIPDDVPMAPEEPMPGGAQLRKPVTDEQEKKKIKTEEQVIKTELTDEQIRQMVMQQYAQVYPRHVMQCPWFGCDYSNPSCMVMATHVQNVHLATLWAQPVEPPQPQLPQEQQPQVSISVPVEVKKEPEQDAEPQQQMRKVVKNQTQEPKKTNPDQMVVKEEIDESNNNQPTVRK